MGKPIAIRVVRIGLVKRYESSAADAQRLETGTVAVNSKKILDFAAPFGGWGQSGIGRELGEEGFRSYLETRTILLS